MRPTDLPHVARSLAPQTLEYPPWLADARGPATFQFSRRWEKLTFRHHAELCAIAISGWFCVQNGTLQATMTACLTREHR